MQPKTTALIIALAIATAILVFLAIRAQAPQAPTQDGGATSAPTRQPVEKTATIYFEPATLSLSSGIASQSVNIMVDTDKDTISGAQVELKYDPRVISNISIAPPALNETGAFFNTNSRQILFNEADPTAGTYSYAIGISPNASPFQGKGKVGTVTFTVNRTAGVTATQISFEESTSVTKIGVFDSILKKADPLTIQL